MAEPLEETYFRWLCAKVVEDTDRTEWIGLLRWLHMYEFVPILPGDHNRAEEGLSVRQTFLLEFDNEVGPPWDPACSIFEMLIALANRASWQTSTPGKRWFWQFIENLGLDSYRWVEPEDAPDVEEKLYALVWRTYDDNGNGGIFPLRSTPYDQRRVEIWYQFSEYVGENNLI